MSATIDNTDKRRREIEAALWDAYEAGQASIFADPTFSKDDSSVSKPDPIGGYWLAVGNFIGKAINAFKPQKTTER